MIEWNELKLGAEYPPDDEVVLVRWEAVYTWSDYKTTDVQYFTATWDSKHKYWSPFTEHVEARGGRDGACLVDLFKDQHIAAWAKIKGETHAIY